jgi:hypothetical protein
MKLTTAQLQQMCAMAGIVLDSQARVQMPEDATQADYVRTVRNMMDMERDVQVILRFAVGNLVYRMPGIEYGDRKAFCIAMFGDELGKSAMNYQWTAHHWDGLPQDVGWGWTWYRRLNRFPPEIKLLYIARWKEPDKKKRLKYETMDTELKAMIQPPEEITGRNFLDEPNLSDYTCPHSTEYVESRTAALRWLECEATEEDARLLQMVATNKFPEDSQDEGSIT